MNIELISLNPRILRFGNHPQGTSSGGKPVVYCVSGNPCDHHFLNTQGGSIMFEYDQHIVNSLLTENNDFKRLYDKHDMLNHRVDEITSGTVPMDDFSLEKLKKEKLQLKDRMATMIEDFRREHV